MYIQVELQVLRVGKKINYVFLTHHLRDLQTPASTCFISFRVFTSKNHVDIVNYLFNLAVTVAVFFIDWLLCLLNVRNFRKLLRYKYKLYKLYYKLYL